MSESHTFKPGQRATYTDKDGRTSEGEVMQVDGQEVRLWIESEANLFWLPAKLCGRVFKTKSRTVFLNETQK